MKGCNTPKKTSNRQCLNIYTYRMFYIQEAF